MVADSARERFATNLLESSPLVDAYAKNDHFGFQVHDLWNGAKRDAGVPSIHSSRCALMRR